MAYEALTQAECQQDEPVTTDLLLKIKNNFEYLYSLIGSGSGGGGGGGGGGIPNGSFEIDEDGDNIPDTWTRYLYPGGSGAYDISAPMHGAKSYKFTRAAGSNNGGGYLESDYIAASELFNGKIGLIYRCSVPGIKVMVQVRQYDKAKVELGGSPVTLFSSTTNPTIRSRIVLGWIPAAGTRFVKVRLIGGYTDTDVAGDVFFDGVELVPVDNRGYVPTINEVSSPTVGWGGDVASFQIYIPFGVTRLRINGELVGTGNLICDSRFRLGGVYSDVNPGAVARSGWTPVTNYIDVSSAQGMVATIYLQLYVGNNLTYYRKQTTDVNDFVG
jgi:hypothetical protein